MYQVLFIKKMYMYNWRPEQSRRVRSKIKRAACSQNNNPQYLGATRGRTLLRIVCVLKTNSKMDSVYTWQWRVFFLKCKCSDVLEMFSNFKLPILKQKSTKEEPLYCYSRNVKTKPPKTPTLSRVKRHQRRKFRYNIAYICIMRK